MKKLIKSYKFWTALAGSVGILLTAISEEIGITINVEGVKEIIMALFGVLVVFGIVKKPSQKFQEPEGITIKEESTQEQGEQNLEQ